MGFFWATILCGGLRAADATDRFAFGGAGGWGDLWAREEDRMSTHGDLFGSSWIRIGVSKRNEFILGYDSIQLKAKNDSDADRKRIRPVTAGLWTSLLPACRWTPVATIGAGVATLNWMGPNGKKSQPALAAQGGLGVEFFPTSSLSVGTLARVHYVASPPGGDRTEATAYTLGVMANVLWGGEEIVTRSGSVIVKEDPVNFPANLADSDGDGVADRIDACPGTPSRAMVDQRGCLVENVSETLDIKFDFGKADLRPEFYPALAKVADFMTRFPDTTVVIEGHTDDVGSVAGNKRLSQERAVAVRAALVTRFGVEASRVTAKGFGAERPILANAGPEGRAANRRVMATISVKK